MRLPIPRAVRGAGAEEKISEILEELSKEYAVFNDFPCPMGNVDHIVVGSTGVFVIETKSHSGEMTLSPEGKLLRNGKPLEKDFLKQVLGQYSWLKKAGRAGHQSGLHKFSRGIHAGLRKGVPAG